MRYQTIHLEFAYEVLVGSRYTLQSDTTFKNAFKTSFNILCLRFVLQELCYKTFF